jgi:transcriptional regulator with XRE-family HTH domain
MARIVHSGTRVRDRRQLLGLKQADVARAAGISPAYLNLIEHNRRAPGPPLLARLAEALQADPAALQDGRESTLAGALRSAAETGADRGSAPETDRIEEFILRFPGWAARLAWGEVGRAEQGRLIARLGDRLAHDPHLSASLHEILSAVTGLRATGEILAGTRDMPEDLAQQFLSNLGADARRVAHAAQALVTWLDTPPEGAGASSPQEEAAAWLAARGFHLAELEAGGDPDALVARSADLTTDASRSAAVRIARRYRADAQALPMPRLLEMLGDDAQRDALRIAGALGAAPALVFRRLASLPQDRAAYGIAACDASGALTHRQPLPAFGMPRFASACPLWPLYDAMLRPGIPVAADLVAAGPVPLRFRAWAVAEAQWPLGYDRPGVTEAVMLIAPAAGPAGGSERTVGATCRVCTAADCPARREPAIGAAAGADDAF